MISDRPILLADGVCNLCNVAVRFILKHERAPTLRFASLQSDAAKPLLEGRDIPDLSTLVLIDDTGVHTRSTAALRLCRHLRAPWRWLAILRVIPRPIRDWCYTRIAKHRYHLFGTTDACPVPPADQQDRFLDADERNRPSP